MKLFIIVGEKSGDQHAARVISELKQQSPSCQIQGYGGEEMEKAGATILKKYHSIAFMGLDFLFSLPRVLKVFYRCKKDIESFKPDMVLFVDFSGFNMRIAKWVFKKRIPSYYYIPPKTWAWNESRNEKLRLYINKVYAILPFEEEYFKTHLVDVKYVGNPSKEMAGKEEEWVKGDYIVLMPGSRKGELERTSSLFREVVEHFPDQHFKVAAISKLDKSYYKSIVGDNVSYEWDNAEDLLKRAKAAVVTSGTATLETALYKVPQVVVYRASKALYPFLRNLIKVKYISLVNLILDKEAVKEFIQTDFTQNELMDEIKRLISSQERIKSITADYQDLHNKLGEKSPSKEVAADLLSELEKIKIT